jgi:hypothetical protein
MRRHFCYVLGCLTAIAAFSTTNAAIAHPDVHAAIPPALPINRLSRDLVPSASEEFFRLGQIQLERELRQLAQNRDLTSEDLLKVLPATEVSPEAWERQNAEPKIELKK